jgi:hypothetical protein
MIAAEEMNTQDPDPIRTKTFRNQNTELKPPKSQPVDIKQDCFHHSQKKHILEDVLALQCGVESV